MMLLIRSTVFNVCFLVLTLIYSTLLLISRPLGFGFAWFWGRAWSASIICLARWICGIRFEIEGCEHLPDEPCVVLAKHQSAWETIAMPSLVPPFVWVLKRELFLIPVFGWALWTIQAIAIRRGNPREALKQVIEQGRRFLENGRWVVMFPEGTRIPPGETGTYHASGIMLAKQAGTGILPMAHNAGQCWPKHGFIKHPGVITVRFLPFIARKTVVEMPRDTLLQMIKTQIESNVREMDG